METKIKFISLSVRKFPRWLFLVFCSTQMIWKALHMTGLYISLLPSISLSVVLERICRWEMVPAITCERVIILLRSRDLRASVYWSVLFNVGSFSAWNLAWCTAHKITLEFSSTVAAHMPLLPTTHGLCAPKGCSLFRTLWQSYGPSLCNLTCQHTKGIPILTSC